MKVIYVRSPYTISIDESGQFGTKLELRVYRKGESVPTDPTYTFTKRNPSVTITENIYNISPFIKEFISHVAPDLTNTITGFEEEDVANWCLVEVKTYIDDVGDSLTYTLVDTLNFVAVNGFTNYTSGANAYTEATSVMLTNDTINRTTNRGLTNFSSTTNIPYFNLLVDWEASTGEELKAIYEKLTGGNKETIIVLDDSSPADIYNFRIPYRWDNVNYGAGNTVQIVDTNTPSLFEIFNYTTVDECKYIPVTCDFVNSYGGWETIVFFKARTDSYEIQSKDYSLLPDNWNYNPQRGETKSFNFTAKQPVKLNTGWVEENFIVLLFDLLVSETVLLDGVSAKVMTKSTPKKTAVKDKMINYEIDFEYNYNIINNTQ